MARWPDFLSHVRLVERPDERRFAWQLQLSGVDEKFVAELDEVVPEERAAWHTAEGLHPAGVVTRCARGR